MKHWKRILSLVLALVMAAGIALPASAGGEEPQSGAAVSAKAPAAQAAAWELDENPVIIVHGIGQSDVYLYDENDEWVLDDEGEPIKGWPPAFDTGSMISTLLLPLLGSLLLQHDVGLTKAVRKLANDILGNYAMDEKARPVLDMRVEKLHRYNGEAAQPTSLADLPKDRRGIALDHIPLNDMAALIGDENLYYFSYDSFGNLEDSTEDLYKTIQDVLKKHGSEKVNIIPISMGGVLMNALVEYHPDVRTKFSNVVYVIAALDGSSIVGDLYSYRAAGDNVSLYKEMLPALVGGWLGNLLNVVIRLLPKKLVRNMLNAVIDGAVGDLLRRSPMIWGLLPQADYDQALKTWLSDPADADVKAQIERYHKAQVNSDKNILAMQKAGVRVYAIAAYNYPLLRIVGSSTQLNADGIIHLDSTSLGATSGFIDTPLPADYKPAKEGYMDKDRIVDASTGTLPDHTFYFKDQNHESTGRCDVIMKLTMRLVTSKNDENVRSMPEWPQFNHGRDGRPLNNAVTAAAKVDTSKLSAEDLAEFNAARAEIENVKAATIVVPGAQEAAQERFTAIMVKIGEWNAEEGESFWEVLGEKVTGILSDIFYYGYGPRGFSDPIWRVCK